MKLVVVAVVSVLGFALAGQAAILSGFTTNYSGAGMPTNILRGSYYIDTVVLQNTNLTTPIYYRLVDSATNTFTMTNAAYRVITYTTATELPYSVTNFAGVVANSIFTNYTVLRTVTNDVSAGSITLPVIASGFVPPATTVTLELGSRVSYGLSVTNSVGGALFYEIQYSAYK